jgi:hypothetical protein
MINQELPFVDYKFVCFYGRRLDKSYDSAAISTRLAMKSEVIV